MVYYDWDNYEYQQCCDIVEYLEEVDCRALCNLAISIIANYPETRDFIIGQYHEIIDLEEE